MLPWVAAVCNFGPFWGLGYILNRRRYVLGVALCAFEYALLIGSFLVVSAPDLPSRVAMYNTFILAVICTWLFLSAALARDAFQDTKRASEQNAPVKKDVRRQQS